MDKENLSLLASLLRANGDALLEGREKLTLSDYLLKNLNDAFNFVVEEETSDSSFMVIKTNNSKVEFFQDIQFLHDFIQKIVRLSVTRDVITHKSTNAFLDISRFKGLQFLELVKVPLKRVCGIQHLRAQLQCVICIHCFHRVQDLLIGCGGDRASGFMWEELSEFVFTYNALAAIDNSFAYAPWLQNVDLSHNRLKSFKTVDCLPNLKFLNLSFNLLECVPILSKESSRKLEVLILKNNYINNISDVAKFENLKHFDVSCNNLSEHSDLLPLRRLSGLVRLNLIGNPLSFHCRHRRLTFQLLHGNAVNCKFILDDSLLSWREKIVLRRATADPEVMLQVRDFDNSLSFSGSSGSASVGQNAPAQGGSASQRSRAGHPVRRVREAVIAESMKDTSDDADAVMDDPDEVQDGGETPGHLEMKRQIEELRERFGEEHWLSQHGASQLHSVLGLPNLTPPPVSLLLASQTPPSPRSTTSVKSHQKERPSSQPEKVQASENSAPPLSEKQNGKIHEQTVVEDVKHNGREQEDEEEEEEEDDDDEDEKISYTESEEDASEGQLFTVWRTDQPSDSLLVAVGVDYLRERDLISGQVKQRWDLAALQSCEQVSNAPPTVQLTFDVLQNSRRKRTYLMEPAEAQVLVRMLGEILASRSLSEMNQVPYRCMKCSLQFCHEEDARMSAKGVPVTCPNCGSKIVCAMEEVPLPSAQAPAQAEISKPLPAAVTPQAFLNSSPSQSSIGSDAGCPSAAALPVAGDHLQVAAVVHRADAPSSSPPLTVSPIRLSPPQTISPLRSSPPQTVSPLRSSPPQTVSPFRSSPLRTSPPLALASARSTMSLESASNGSALTARRCDSDIEVISNPSQSSIEILEGEARTPGRKRSSEERQPLTVDAPVAPQVAPPPPAAAAVVQGLTESSSSGSFTDSVCTTYETHTASSVPLEPDVQKGLRVNAVAPSRAAKKQIGEAIDEAAEESPLYERGPATTFQEIFEGLLESVDKKLATNIKPALISNTEDSPLQYSYSDFQCIDHRLKLYLFQHIFEAEGEDLLLLIRADILLQSQTVLFPGLLVITSLRLVVLRVVGPEGESPEQWLRKEATQPLKKVTKIFPLPWAQGVGVQCGDSVGCVLVILQDQEYTHNFLGAAESILPCMCGVVRECAEYHHMTVRQLVLAEAVSGEADAPVRLVALFCHCTAHGYDEFKLPQGALVVTTCDLILTQTDMQWLFPSSAAQPIEARAAQKMSNLLEVEASGNSLGLQFLDEAENKEMAWNFKFQSAGCVEAVVTALRAPWEQLFCVPLQVVCPEL